MDGNIWWPYAQAEIMSTCFQSVLTYESSFEELIKEINTTLNKNEVDMNETKKMENIDITKKNRQCLRLDVAWM